MVPIAVVLRLAIISLAVIDWFLWCGRMAGLRCYFDWLGDRDGELKVQVLRYM